MSMPRLAILLALFLLAGVVAEPARATETEIVCGDEEEPMPALDEDGFVAEPDSSTEADRAGDYDDSAEDETIPEDDGDELTPQERAAIDTCLADAAMRSMTKIVRALRKPARPRSLMRIGPEQLPYGGRADLTLRRRAGAQLLGRARVNLRSGDERGLRLRLTTAGRRALRAGRVRVLVRLKLTDASSGRTASRRARVALPRIT